MRVAGRPGMQSAAGAWREKGYRDGKAGRDANTSRIVVDEHEAAYMAGHRQGTTALAKESSVREPQAQSMSASSDTPADAVESSGASLADDAGSRADEQDEEL